MNQLLRNIPKVDDLLRNPALAETIAQYGVPPVTEAIRRQLDALRQEILTGQADILPELPVLCQQIRVRVQQDSLPSFRGVINGTGIILHTNLGRACLSDNAANAVYDAARSYSNLEYDLESG